MDIESIFRYSAEKMKLEWATIKASLDQSGDKGTALEKTVMQFLRPYIPKNLGMVSGEITDSDGNSTKQMDIIIYDEIKAPLLYDVGDIRVIPIECVYAVIEVKSNIASQNDVDDIFEKMLSVKKLQKTSFYPTQGATIHSVSIYGKDWTIWPVHFFAFSIDSMSIDTLATKIDQKHKEQKLDVEKRIDSVCVLEKGVIFNKLVSGSYSALPEPNSEITFHHSENPWMFFYVLISRYLNQAWIPNFNFIKFTKNIIYKSKNEPKINDDTFQ
jgi:hypothetical protein